MYYSDFGGYRPEGPGCPNLRISGSAFTDDRWMFATEAQFTAPEPGPIDVVIYASNNSPGPRYATAVLIE